MRTCDVTADGPRATRRQLAAAVSAVVTLATAVVALVLLREVRSTSKDEPQPQRGCDCRLRRPSR